MKKTVNNMKEKNEKNEKNKKTEKTNSKHTLKWLYANAAKYVPFTAVLAVLRAFCVCLKKLA